MEDSNHTLHEKSCLHLEFFWSVFSRMRTEYLLQMWENTEQKNSKYENFSRSDSLKTLK